MWTSSGQTGLARRLGEQPCHVDLAVAKLVRLLAVAPEVRGEEHGVDLGRLEQRARRVREAVGVLLARAGEVDRVRGRGRLGQQRLQDGLGGRRQLGQIEPCGPAEVGRERAVAAAVAHDRDAPAPRPGRGEEGLGQVDQLPGRVDPEHAGRAAGGVDRGEAARQRARVRARGAGPRGGTSDREQDDGLAGGAGRLGERPAVAEILHVDADHAGRLVRRERGHELGRVQVGLVAHRDEPREPEAEVGEQQSGLERDVAALGDEPDRAARQRVRRQVELGLRVEDPEAVRAYEHRRRRHAPARRSPPRAPGPRLPARRARPRSQPARVPPRRASRPRPARGRSPGR